MFSPFCFSLTNISICGFADISKHFSLLLSVRERGEGKGKKKKRIYIVLRHCWSLKSILPAAHRVAASVWKTLCLSSFITFAISFPYTSAPDLKISSPPPPKENDFVKKLLPESQFFSHPSVVLAGSLIQPSLLQKESVPCWASHFVAKILKKANGTKTSSTKPVFRQLCKCPFFQQCVVCSSSSWLVSFYSSFSHQVPT